MYKMRKQYQRKFNKRVRSLNRNIASDNLWLGRFEFRQIKSRWEEFSDGSGGILHVQIRGYDKATGYYKDYFVEYAPWLHSVGWKLWEIGNKFITEDAEVWKEDPRPGLNNGFVKDYTNKHISENVLREPDNYYLSYQYWKESV